MGNDTFKNVSFYQKYQAEEEMKEELEEDSSEDSEEEERKTNDFKNQFLNELSKNRMEFDKKAIIITEILQDESLSVKTEEVANRSSSVG